VITLPSEQNVREPCVTGWLPDAQESAEGANGAAAEPRADADGTNPDPQASGVADTANPAPQAGAVVDGANPGLQAGADAGRANPAPRAGAVGDRAIPASQAGADVDGANPGRLSSTDEHRPLEMDASMRLHRSSSDRVVLGVCGGLAELLQVDAGLVRLAFAIGTLWGGAGLLLYVVLAVILPVDPRDAAGPFRTPAERTQLLTGVVLIALGGLLLASDSGLAPWLTWNLFWPSLVILIGVGLVVRRRRPV